MSGSKVLVYGDVMVDVYVTGSVKRDSPEAPGVHVLSDTAMSEFPGGAANVAVNIASLGGDVVMLGVIGRDASGTLLDSALAETGVTIELLVRDEARTTSKTRFMADGRQLLRVDMEEPSPLKREDETELLERLRKYAPQADAIVISDYAKGAVTPRIATALILDGIKHGVPVIVDAKEPGARQYSGATVIKPNLKEITLALKLKAVPEGKDAIKAAQSLLAKSAGTKYLLLTMGENGMVLAAHHGHVLEIKAHPVNAVDVTGAGDAVAAALALALANGEDIIDATHFANAAAAVVVTKSGTARPTPAEVLFFYDRDTRPERGHVSQTVRMESYH